MNFPFYIARRYLFSKKKHNAINIISGISVCGVALATLALICTLSVFNGFQDMVASFFTAFDPQLKIVVREGKVFDGQDERIRAVCALPEVAVSTEALEENAMVQYKDRQTMAVLKGVEDNFEELTEIDSILYGAGEFLLHDSIVNYGIMGVELVATLGTGLEFVDPLQVYLPKRNAKVNMANPGASFKRDYLYSPGVVFVVNQQLYDGKYILTETETPDGYNTMHPITFSIVASHDTASANPTLTELNGDKVSGEIEFATNINEGTLTANVVNYKGSELPNTGGMGTTILYAAGVILILAAGAFLLMQKKAENK